MQNIQIYDTEDELFYHTAALFLSLSAEIMQKEKKMVLALSGGGTPNKLYSHLIRQKDLVPWQDVDVYFSDERLVPLDNAESNYYQACKNLLNQVGHPSAQRFPADVTLSVEDASKEYENRLMAQVPLMNGVPCFDIIFLGLGSDGHTASLFPQQIGKEIFERFVIPATAKYQDRPSARISMTPKIFNQAKNVIFLVSGQGKAQAVYNSLMKNQDWHDWPASSISGKRNDVYWLIDAASAKYLSSASDSAE
jgi:6-phosphogluconolactonase